MAETPEQRRQRRSSPRTVARVLDPEERGVRDAPRIEDLAQREANKTQERQHRRQSPRTVARVLDPEERATRDAQSADARAQRDQRREAQANQRRQETGGRRITPTEQQSAAREAKQAEQRQQRRDSPRTVAKVLTPQEREKRDRQQADEKAQRARAREARAEQRRRRNRGRKIGGNGEDQAEADDEALQRRKEQLGDAVEALAFPAVVGELSDLADVLVEAALGLAARRIEARHPGIDALQRFAVAGAAGVDRVVRDTGFAQRVLDGAPACSAVRSLTGNLA
jgi:hypothetical protein